MPRHSSIPTAPPYDVPLPEDDIPTTDDLIAEALDYDDFADDPDVTDAVRE